MYYTNVYTNVHHVLYQSWSLKHKTSLHPSLNYAEVDAATCLINFKHVLQPCFNSCDCTATKQLNDLNIEKQHCMVHMARCQERCVIGVKSFFGRFDKKYT